MGYRERLEGLGKPPLDVPGVNPLEGLPTTPEIIVRGDRQILNIKPASI